MKAITFLLSIVLTANLFGQETTTAEFKKIQLGINISPDYCFRTLNNGSSIDETGKLGYTAGLNMNYNFNKNIGIGLGIHYSIKGYKTSMNALSYGDMIDPNYGFIYDPSHTGANIKYIYNFHYLDIPLKVNFVTGKKKIRFITSVGLTTNVFIKETATRVIEYQDGTHNRKTHVSNYNYNTINLSPTASFGIDWKLNSKNNLRIEPTFRYGVLKIINAPVTGYLWNAGLNVSYYFGLK